MPGTVSGRPPVDDCSPSFCDKAAYFHTAMGDEEEPVEPSVTAGGMHQVSGVEWVVWGGGGKGSADEGESINLVMFHVEAALLF